MKAAREKKALLRKPYGKDICCTVSVGKKKNPWVSGPACFKPELFKGQRHLPRHFPLENTEFEGIGENGGLEPRSPVFLS